MDGKKGVALFESGMYEEACPHLEEEASCESPAGLATLYLGAVRTLRTRERGDLDAALKKVGGNVSEDLAMQVSGGVLYDIGAVDEGLDRMRRAVELNPTHKNIAVLASRLDKHIEHEDEAAHLYCALLDRDQDDLDGLTGLACFLIGKGNLDRAEPLLRRALSVAPEHAVANYELGNLLATRGQYEEALSRFQSAVELMYWRPWAAWEGVGYCQLKLGRREEARIAALKALDINPDYEYAKELLSDLH